MLNVGCINIEYYDLQQSYNTVYLKLWGEQMHVINCRHLILLSNSSRALIVELTVCDSFNSCNIGVVPFTSSSTYTNIIFLDNQVLQTTKGCSTVRVQYKNFITYLEWNFLTIPSTQRNWSISEVEVHFIGDYYGTTTRTCALWYILF